MPARYDLNQIPYEYAVKVTDSRDQIWLTVCLKELWTGVHNIVQEMANKTIHKKEKQEGKVVI